MMNNQGGVIVEYLDRYRKRMKLNGNSIREANIKNSKMLLKQTFCDDASYTIGVYMWQLGLLQFDDYDNCQPISIRLYERNYSNANGVTIKFQTLIDTPICVGDIVYCSQSKEYLLCTEVFNINGIHWQGKFTLCNWILKWQNENGDILQYPCYVINSTQYNSGEQSNKQFTIGSSQHLVKLPCDENTVNIRTPQRFMLDKNYSNPVSYCVTQNDTTSYNYGTKGIVSITLLEHPVNYSTDRIDLGICDYKDLSNHSENTENKDKKSVIEYETNIIKSGGDIQAFKAKFYDGNVENNNIKPKWEIVCDFVDEININQKDNKIFISIDNDDYIDEDFKLIVSDENNDYQSSILITIKSLL